MLGDRPAPLFPHELSFPAEAPAEFWVFAERAGRRQCLGRIEDTPRGAERLAAFAAAKRGWRLTTHPTTTARPTPGAQTNEERA